MNADAFRHLYEYHFNENRRIWDRHIMTLSDEQFTRTVDYSMGSVQNHIVHMMNADRTWFGALRGIEPPEDLQPENFADRSAIRAFWDTLEQEMWAYLAELKDDMLFTHPFTEGIDQILVLWQVLLHVANHGTDHRAQLLRILHDMGADTGPQDYIFYIFDTYESRANTV